MGARGRGLGLGLGDAQQGAGAGQPETRVTVLLLVLAFPPPPLLLVPGSLRDNLACLGGVGDVALYLQAHANNRRCEVSARAHAHMSHRHRLRANFGTGARDTALLDARSCTVLQTRHPSVCNTVRARASRASRTSPSEGAGGLLH
jgi:hypothetical protein